MPTRSRRGARLLKRHSREAAQLADIQRNENNCLRETVKLSADQARQFSFGFFAAFIRS
ncbi:hypothetical protein DP49_5164 [Burkholderia pseudomallei]|nr:hypothetical protein DP49_5164 [Burkholderia pseudomallei]